MSEARPRFIAGVMTGTSLDGLDVAVAEVTGKGLDINVRLLGLHSASLGELASALRPLAGGAPTEPAVVLRLARQLGTAYAAAISTARTRFGVMKLDLVAAHGQTVWHLPQENLSWQLLDPWPIVRRLRVPVVYDLRQADLIAGGQGAPITPLADWVLLRDAATPRLIVNLGGICNVTELPPNCQPQDVLGYDAGPCNLLIDGAVRLLHPHLSYDTGGALAAAGMPRGEARELLHDAPFYRRSFPRTTGREDFNDAFVRDVVQRLRERGLSDADLLASVVDAVAAEVADCAGNLGQNVQVVLAGGGALNRFLVNRIGAHCGSRGRVMLSDELGVPAQGREALEMAVLGALCQDAVPITLPRVTGADHPGRAGAWVYP